jgi:hypothetical protein
VRNDPDYHEPRAPAVAIWTGTGLLLGLAMGIVVGNLAVTVLVGAIIGLLAGLYLTRPKRIPGDD